MSTHGPLHDEFRRSPRDPHGPEHDEFHDGGAAQSGKRGAQHDEFGKPAVGNDRHGARWDDFGWTAMPMLHGGQHDENFATVAALDGGAHGTWHDVFRGGTQVRYIIDGCDCEGTVLNTGHDHVIVEPKGGGRHELALGQITALRWATDSGQPDRGGIKNAKPGHTSAPYRRSPADAPSAHDATARGGGRTEGIGPGQDRAPLNVGKSLDESLGELRKIAADL